MASLKNSCWSLIAGSWQLEARDKQPVTFSKGIVLNHDQE